MAPGNHDIEVVAGLHGDKVVAIHDRIHQMAPGAVLIGVESHNFGRRRLHVEVGKQDSLAFRRPSRSLSLIVLPDSSGSRILPVGVYN